LALTLRGPPGGDRRQQVQSGKPSGPQLYQRQALGQIRAGITALQ
jgi:hypothetical protein